MNENRFTPEHRLRKQRDFDHVYQARLFAADHVLIINAVPNGHSTVRLGLSVSRKVGNAVVRNRWKRRIREVFRQVKSELPTGWDIVVRPQRDAVLDYQAIKVSLPRLIERILRRNRARKEST